MNAHRIVDILLESDAEEFVSSLPPDALASFHISHDGDQSVHISNRRYRGHYLVYVNEPGGTRDYIGLINVMPEPRPGDPPAGPPGWIITAVAKKHPGRATSLRSAYTGERYDTPHEAARELYRRYLRQSA